MVKEKIFAGNNRSLSFAFSAALQYIKGEKMIQKDRVHCQQSFYRI